MKNKFKNLFLALIVALMLPLVSLLSACGATPSGEVTGILFDTMKYDESGVPVFEIDKGVTTELAYKIYPSSASGYKVYFDPIDKGTAENSSRFTFKDGTITINSNDFEDVRYKVRVGDYSDTCIIKLKQYPIEISTDESDIVLNTFDVKAINVKAKFVNSAGVVTTKNITENDFNFLVESSDETVIDIPNKNRLKFSPFRNESAEAVVTVTLLDTNFEPTNLSFKIKVKVVQNISDSFVIVSGSKKFVKDGDNIQLNYSDLETENGFKVVKFDVFAVNANRVLVKDENNYSIHLSSKKFAKLSDDEKYILINGSVESDYELKVQVIYAGLTMESGSTFTINLNITIKR